MADDDKIKATLPKEVKSPGKIKVFKVTEAEK